MKVTNLDLRLDEGGCILKAPVTKKIMTEKAHGGGRVKCRYFLLFSALVLIVAGSASAQATRTWVSGVGDDVNPCSRTAPCKTFAGAISKTASGGIIDALDPGGYGTVTVTKPITIEGTGTLASILASGVQGVIVNITSGTNRDVVLRDLLINGAGTTIGTTGVNFIAGDSLTVERVDIQQFSANGILFQPNSNAHLTILRSAVMLTNVGTTVAPVSPATAALATIFDSEFNRNTVGLKCQDLSRTTVNRSSANNNTNEGFFGNGLTGAGLFLMLDHCDASNNGTGIHSHATASVRVNDCTITGNSTGLSSTSSGALISYTSNRLAQNATDGAFTTTDVNH